MQAHQVQYTPFNCPPHRPGTYLPAPSNALSQFAITASLLAYRPFPKLTSYSLFSLRALFSISSAAIGIAREIMKNAYAKILGGQQKVLWFSFFLTRPILSCFKTSSLARAFLEMKL